MLRPDLSLVLRWILENIQRYQQSDRFSFPEESQKIFLCSLLRPRKAWIIQREDSKHARSLTSGVISLLSDHSTGVLHI